MKRIITALVALVLLFVQIQVRAAGGWETVNDSGRVAVLGDMKVDEKTAGDVVAIGGSADINADVSGDVVVIMGDLKLDAAVSGDVVTILGRVTLADGARVMGDMVALGSVDKANGAYINGENVIIKSGLAGIRGSNIEFLVLIRFVILFVSLLLLMIFGLPVIYFASQRFMNIETGIESGMGKKFAIGFLGLIAGFIIMLLFCWTLIVPLAFVLFVFLAKIAAYMYIGKTVIRLSNARLNIYLEFVTGVIAIVLLKIILLMLIPQSYMIQGIIADGILNIIVDSFGVGLLVDTKFGKSVF